LACPRLSPGPRERFPSREPAPGAGLDSRDANSISRCENRVRRRAFRFHASPAFGEEPSLRTMRPTLELRSQDPRTQ
jgi:hypothetical protein